MAFRINCLKYVGGDIMLSYLQNYRKARLKNWIIIPPILFSLMLLFFVMGMLFTAPTANIYNCYNVGFGALCDCMFFEHTFRSNFRDERLYD